jgi:hypothetical protein
MGVYRLPGRLRQCAEALDGTAHDIGTIVKNSLALKAGMPGCAWTDGDRRLPPAAVAALRRELPGNTSSDDAPLARPDATRKLAARQRGANLHPQNSQIA